MLCFSNTNHGNVIGMVFAGKEDDAYDCMEEIYGICLKNLQAKQRACRIDERRSDDSMGMPKNFFEEIRGKFTSPASSASPALISPLHRYLGTVVGSSPPSLNRLASLFDTCSTYV